LRIVTTAGTRASTAVAGATSSDGALTFLDLSRWEIPSHVPVHANVKATASAVTPTAADQWLVLVGPDGVTTVSHLDPTGLATSVGVTAGFTPTDRWTVTREGILPWLSSRRAEVGNDGLLWLAMQVTDPDAVTTTEVVRLFDPVLGVHAGDTVVFDPNLVGTCQAFEASVGALLAPDPARFPGGAVRLDPRATADVGATLEWARCMSLLGGAAITSAPSPVRNLRATIRAAGYVLVRGKDQSMIHVGRPDLASRFDVKWEDEAALAATCLLPPAKAWPPSAPDATACGEGSGCRLACERLVRARLARRVGYLSEANAAGVPTLQGGPALSFTLALETAVAPVRDLRLVIETSEGRTPFRVAPSSASLVGNGPVVPWDRSPYTPLDGIRFFSPYASGVVLEATPTVNGGNVNTIR
ncbi:MAG TPA: hypothetical protein VF875_02035, partial [Anaeromyxobacter sp.]